MRCVLDGCDGVTCARGQVPLACVNTAGWERVEDEGDTPSAESVTTRDE